VDRKQILWILIAAGAGLMLAMLWSKQNQPAANTPPASQPAQVATQPSTAPAAGTTAGSVVAARPGGEQFFDNSLADSQMCAIGSLDPVSGYLFQVELDNEGAAVYTLKLSKYFATVDDKRRYDSNPATYEQARRENPEKYKGHFSLLNPVPNSSGGFFLPLATQELRVTIEGETAPHVVNLAQKKWKRLTDQPSTSPDADIARFGYTLYEGRDIASAKPLLRLVKTYLVRKNDYSVEMSLSAENLSGKSIQLSIAQSGPTGVPREDPRSDMRVLALGHLKGNEQAVVVKLKPLKDLESMPLDQPQEVGRGDGSDPMLWIGDVDKFFGSIMYLKPDQSGRLEAPEYHPVFTATAAQETPNSRTYVPGVTLTQIALKPGQSRQAAFDVFAGPKKREIFVDSGAPYYQALYQQLRYIDTIDFGSCFCTYGPLALGIMWLLEFFSKVSFGNFGVAIILLVALVRLALHPLTKKGQVAMSKMQKLTPQIQKLREKYANDKDTLNKETMKLYKDAGATPILGCLPMLLQMPIWVALWGALNASIELRHAAFLPFWITDLAAPDTVFSWSRELPFIGNQLHLLPLLLTVAMALQSKYTPQQAATTPEQASQQKMMMYMMPLMMLFFFYTAPSGLTLYIMTSTFAGVAEQIVIRRHIQQKEAEDAAAEVTVDMPGKGPRGARPKKAKGPSWFKQG
jgi:YidC/Oxa1 family membrane protein insertase